MPTAVTLTDMLTLVGLLSDQPGADAPRERFRTFLARWNGGVSDICSLIDDARQAPGDQAQRVVADLVITLGRHLGFDTAYGMYERPPGGVRFDGAWRSPGRARVVLEVRTDRTRPFDPDDLSRTLKAMPVDAFGAPTEPTRGLCVVVTPYGSRHTDAPAVVPAPDVCTLPLAALLSFAEMVQAGSMTHEQMVDVILGRAGVAPIDESPAVATVSPSRLALVPKEAPPDYWVATIHCDDGTPEQFVEAVIARRRILGVSAIGIFPASARPGDWVCFFIRGAGIVGHARLDQETDRATAPLRDADRFAAVFTLAALELYGTSIPLDFASPAQRLADRAPLDLPGPFLSPIAEHDFRDLTTRSTTRDSVGTAR